MKYISFGKIEGKFVIIVIIIIIVNIPTALYEVSSTDDYFKNSRIMTVTLKHTGLSLCFIPHLIVKAESQKGVKKKSSLKYKFLLIIFISILYLIHDFAYIFSDRLIQVEIRESPIKNIMHLHLQGNFFFFFIVISIISSFLFKKKYYKHQYISMFIIITLGIIRYIVKLYSYLNNKTISLVLMFGEIGFHILIYICNALYLSLTKLLIENLFVTPWKISFYIGIINVFLNLSLYFLFTMIPFEKKTWYCSIQYKDKYYIDNIFSFFEVYSQRFTKIIQFFIIHLLTSIRYISFNLILEKYFFFHIFLSYQLINFLRNIIKVINLDEFGSFIDFIIIITFLLELFANSVLLEFVILNFCGLNKDTKVNIIMRAIEDLNSSNENDNMLYKVNLGDSYYSYLEEGKSNSETSNEGVELMNSEF